MRMHEPHSGTKDENYDLLTVTQLCLEHVWRLEQYAQDAERGRDPELAALFRRMQEHSRRGAQECKRLLQRRMRDETYDQDRGRGELYWGSRFAERSPSGVGFAGYDTAAAWERPAPASQRAEWYSAGRYAGHGPKGWTRSPERIVERVSERLADHPDIDASDVQVDAQNDVVILRGRVSDRGQKRLAEDVAESVSGVSDVRNELDVDKGMLQELTEAVTGRSEKEEHPAAPRERSRV